MVGFWFLVYWLQLANLKSLEEFKVWLHFPTTLHLSPPAMLAGRSRCVREDAPGAVKASFSGDTAKFTKQIMIHSQPL